MAMLRSIWVKLPRKFRENVWSYLRAPVNLMAHLYSDGFQFLRHNTFLNPKSHIALEFRLLMFTHMVEKGFSLTYTKPFFGRDVIQLLIGCLEDAIDSGYDDSDVLGNAARALNYYFQPESSPAGDQPKWHETLKKRFNSLLAKNPKVCSFFEHQKSILVICSDSRVLPDQASLDEFMRSRHSVRRFSNLPVARDSILSAIAVAQRSPSSCNLQPTRIYVETRVEKVKDILNIQGGARGFAQEVPVLLIVTFKVGLQIGPRSRHQGFTDSGIFAGFLMLSLHARNIASCPLNWAQERRQTRLLREAASIPCDENIVMLIACGFKGEACSVAASYRKDTASIVHFLDSNTQSH